MSKNTRGYTAWYSIFYGLISLGAYVLMVLLGVHGAWSNLMRNGEPGILELEPIGKIAMTATYQSHITNWCLLFAGFGVILFAIYWRIGSSHEDADTIRRTAHWYRLAALNIMVILFISYYKFIFAGKECVTLLSITQLIIAFFWFAGYAIHFLNIVLRRRKIRRRVPSERLARKLAAKARHYREPFSFLDSLPFIVEVLSLFVALVDLCANIMTVPLLIVTALSAFSVPAPFVVVTLYDWCVLFLPLVAIILFALNLKYNAPPIIGESLSFAVNPFRGVYHQVTYRQSPKEAQSNG